MGVKVSIVAMDSNRTRQTIFGIGVALLVVTLALLWVPFFPALAFALIITVLTSGWFNRLAEKWQVRGPLASRTLAALTVIGILVFAFAGPLASIGVLAGSQANKFLSDFQASAPTGVNAFSPEYVLEKVDQTLGPTIRNLGFDLKAEDWYFENKDQISESVRSVGGNVVKSLGTSILIIVIGFLTAFFMMRDGRNLLEPTRRLLPLTEQQILHLCQRVHATTHAVLVGIVIVSIIQGTLAGVVYAIAGVPNSLMWGVATIIVCMIPLLGAPLVYVPVGLTLLSAGKVWQGLLVLGVGFGLISQIDNLLRPFFIGAKTKLHPMAIFFSLLGGVLLWGPLGLFLGPMLLTLVLGLMDLVAENCDPEQNLENKPA